MSAITFAAASSAANAVALPLGNAASAATDSGTPAAKAMPPDAAGSPGRSRPTDIIDLSDRAKATLERAKSEYVAAGKLNAQLQAMRDPDGKEPAPEANSDDGTELFYLLSGRAKPQQAGDTQWIAGAPYGNAAITDADLTATLKGTLLQHANTLPPGPGQALRNAVADGTLKFQKASDVPGLNFHSSTSFTPGAIAGRFDLAISTSQHPTGATKVAIDRGTALAMWTADRGDTYISW
jgi:hypothetical protein